MSAENRFKSIIVMPQLWFLMVVGASLGITVWAYQPGLNGPFLLDDFVNIDRLRMEVLDWNSVANAFLNNHSGKLGRPISSVTLALSSYFGGHEAGMFKYHNLMLHLLTGMLLIWLTYRIARQLLGVQHEGRAVLIAAFAGAIWLAHPFLVSTVLYAVQRMAILSAMFMVAGMLVYVIGRVRLNEARKGGLLLMLAALFVFGPAAAFSKENGVLLPLFILAIEWVVFRFETPAAKGRQQLRLYHLLLIIAPLVIGVIYFLINFSRFTAGFEYRDFTLLERVYTQGQLMWYYLMLILVPRISEMSLYQDGFTKVTEFNLMTALAFAAIITAFALAWRLRGKAPVLSLAILWFFAAHAMESTFLPLELAFEHRNYLASFGIVFAVVFYLFKPYGHGQMKLGFPVVGALLMLGFVASMTHDRAKIWDKFHDIVLHAYENHPYSARASSDMATLQIVTKSPRKAKFLLERAYHYFPERRLGTSMHTMWAMCDEREIPRELFAEVMWRLQQDRFSPYVVAVYDRLQMFFSSNDCPAMRPQHFLLMSEAALKNPNAQPGKRYGYWFHSFRGNALMYMGRYQEGMAYYDKAFEMFGNPNSLLGMEILFEKFRWQVVVAKFDDAEATIRRFEEISAARPVPIDHKIAELRMRLDEAKRHPERWQRLAE